MPETTFLPFDFLFFPEVDATLKTKREPLTIRKKKLRERLGAKGVVELTPVEAWFDLCKRTQSSADGTLRASKTALAKAWGWDVHRVQPFPQELIKRGMLIHVERGPWG